MPHRRAADAGSHDGSCPVSVWLSHKGESSLLDEVDAQVSVFDHGLTVGDGVFETLKVVEGEPMALSRHLRRLEKSCDVLGLTRPDEGKVRAGVREVIATSTEAARLGRLRITCTGGFGPLASDRTAGASTIVIALTAMQPWPASTSVVVVPWLRNEHSAVVGAKTTSYAENVVALQWAHKRGFSEGLFANTAGRLCEGTGTNVFVVRGEEVLTPSLASGCLAGITRELLLEWGWVREETLYVEDLMTCDEIFLTSSTRDVHPVLQAGERQWTDVGPISRRISADYVRRMAVDIDP